MSEPMCEACKRVDIDAMTTGRVVEAPRPYTPEEIERLTSDLGALKYIMNDCHNKLRATAELLRDQESKLADAEKNEVMLMEVIDEQKRNLEHVMRVAAMVEERPEIAELRATVKRLSAPVSDAEARQSAQLWLNDNFAGPLDSDVNEMRVLLEGFLQGRREGQ